MPMSVQKLHGINSTTHTLPGVSVQTTLYPRKNNELDINVNEETQHLNCNCNVFQKQLPIACFQMITQTFLVQERFSASNVAASQPLTSMNPAVGLQ